MRSTWPARNGTPDFSASRAISSATSAVWAVGFSTHGRPAGGERRGGGLEMEVFGRADDDRIDARGGSSLGRARATNLAPTLSASALPRPASTSPMTATVAPMCSLSARAHSCPMKPAPMTATAIGIVSSPVMNGVGAREHVLGAMAGGEALRRDFAHAADVRWRSVRSRAGSASGRGSRSRAPSC